MDGFAAMSAAPHGADEPITGARPVVLRVITEVAADHGKRLPPLQDDLQLLDSGLDSLCLAVIVSCLEDELGVDPFGMQAEIDFPRTVGEFIRLYERPSV